MAKKKNDTCFVVTYKDPAEDKVVSLKARSIGDSSLGLSFIRISDFLFETSSLVVKPEEEALEKKFANTKSLHLSIYTVISIEEVGMDHQGLQFKSDKSNLVVLPTTARDKPQKD